MARINLSIDEELFNKLEKEAIGKSTTVNLLVIDILSNLYCNDVFNYSDALKRLIDEAEYYAKQHPSGFTFVLASLPSFSEICVARAANASIKPSMIRARLGKMFFTKVNRGEVAKVMRSKNDDGSLRFIDNTTVYEVI